MRKYTASTVVGIAGVGITGVGIAVCTPGQTAVTDSRLPVPSVCDRRDRQTAAETWRDRRDAEEKNQKCIKPINKKRKLQKCS